VGEREVREREFFDELVEKGSPTRSLLDRFSQAYYEKSDRGRVWSTFWERTDLTGKIVLDYGCGNGDFSKILAERGALVYGIDISPNLVDLARAATAGMGLNGRSPQFFVGDAHHTPFESGMFDYVLGNGALHHLDLDKAYAEIARVLKPGGKAVFQEPMFHHPLLWLLRRLTPKTHTADERPLSLSDIDRARRWFRVCEHREHFLLAVCAAPAHLLGKRFALSAVGFVDRVDGVLMGVVPSLRKFAWLTLVEMEK
jgi:SAM-dependent methyltransferase